MKKMTFGALLVLAMVIPVSASPITESYLTSLFDNTLIDPSFTSPQYFTSIPVNAMLTVSFAPATQWTIDPVDTPPYGDPVVIPWYATTLTINFSTPVSAFGLWVEPAHPGTPYNFTVDYFSGTNEGGTLLDSLTGNLSTWGFFGAADPAIGSVRIVTTDYGTFLASDMRLQLVAPEPSTSLLLAAGLLGLGLVSRRRLAR